MVGGAVAKFTHLGGKCTHCGAKQKVTVAKVTITAAIWGVSPRHMPDSMAGRLEWYREAQSRLKTVKGDDAWNARTRIGERIRVLETLVKVL